MKARTVCNLRREGAIVLDGPEAGRSLADKAPLFDPLVQRHGPACVPEPSSVFETIIEAICHQQLSMEAGRAIYQRIHEAFPDGLTPQAAREAPKERFTEAGLSNPKAGYVASIADALEKTRLTRSTLEPLPDERVFQTLTDLPGVGPWTARIVMLFALHRDDVLPHTDHGLLDGARRVLDLPETPSPDALARRAQAWRPHRSIAAWYLWAERDRLLQEAGKRSP